MILQITHLGINPSERHYVIRREIPSNIRITLTQIAVPRTVLAKDATTL